MISRRTVLQAMGLPALATLVPHQLVAASDTFIAKKIPSSGEMLNVIGMGTSRTFNHLDNPEMHPQLLKVLQDFFALGGQMIDSSPMYGSAETLFGNLLKQLPKQDKIFAASKVWTDGEQAGIAAVAESRKRMAVDKMDLMQVHNLRDWEIHIESLKEMKESGEIRYTGITTSRDSQYDDFERVMRAEPLDFIQINYSFGERKAEEKILPLAQERGIAVIINRPFLRGRLFSATKGKELPEFVNEFGCTSWAQFFLKFVVSHPAVTCAIPATSKPKHMKDNMLAQQGRLPDSKQRQMMLDFMNSL